MRTRARPPQLPWAQGQIWRGGKGGAHGDTGGDFYAAKQLSGLQLFKKSFHCLPSPLNCPNSSEITASHVAANWEICFTASTGRKQNTPFGCEGIFLSHYCKKDSMFLLVANLCFKMGHKYHFLHIGVVCCGQGNCFHYLLSKYRLSH